MILVSLFEKTTYNNNYSYLYLFKDLLIEVENLRNLLQMLATNINTSEATAKLASMEQSVNSIEEKISLLEVEVQDRERQWKLFLENLQVVKFYLFH